PRHRRARRRRRRPGLTAAAGSRTRAAPAMLLGTAGCVIMEDGAWRPLADAVPAVRPQSDRSIPRR
ncbi:MAG: hypothetical protein ACXV0U_07655, partial [Kineosporiaceae bacterium]